MLLGVTTAAVTLAASSARLAPGVEATRSAGAKLAAAHTRISGSRAIYPEPFYAIGRVTYPFSVKTICPIDSTAYAYLSGLMRYHTVSKHAFS